MLRQVSLIEAVGKTLVDFASSAQCPQYVLVFGDGTFAVIAGGTEYRYDTDMDPDLITVTEADLNLFGFGDEALISLGIVSPEELSARRQTEIDKMPKRQPKPY